MSFLLAALFYHSRSAIDGAGTPILTKSTTTLLLVKPALCSSSVNWMKEDSCMDLDAPTATVLAAPACSPTLAIRYLLSTTFSAQNLISSSANALSSGPVSGSSSSGSGMLSSVSSSSTSSSSEAITPIELEPIVNNSIDVAVYSDEYSDEEFITSPVVVICDQKTTAQGSYAFFKNESYVSLGSNYGEGSCSDLASESDGSSQEENSPADQAGVLQDARKFTPHTQPRQYSPQVELYRSTFALHTIAEEFVTYDDNLLSTVVQEDVVYTVRNRQESACGKIVEARSNLGQDVTIKILAKSSKEVKVIQSLASRRTMFMDKPLAIVLDSRYAYIVMKKYSNTLAQLIHADPSIPPRMVKVYCAELLIGLSLLHPSKIVHRDLQPKNVFVKSDGHLVISGFQYATFSTNANINKLEKMREAGYLAPELMSHRPTSDAYKSSVDIWGFGMIVFELLTGKRCVEGVSPTELNYKNRMVPYLIHDAINELVHDEDAADLLHKILQGDAHRRPTWRQIIKHKFFSNIFS